MAPLFSNGISKSDSDSHSEKRHKHSIQEPSKIHQMLFFLTEREDSHHSTECMSTQINVSSYSSATSNCVHLFLFLGPWSPSHCDGFVLHALMKLNSGSFSGAHGTQFPSPVSSTQHPMSGPLTALTGSLSVFSLFGTREYPGELTACLLHWIACGPCVHHGTFPCLLEPQKCISPGGMSLAARICSVFAFPTCKLSIIILA